MSKYTHEDRKEYIIAEGEYYKVWNNGIVECLQHKSNKWREQNSNYTWEERLKFLKCWERIPIGSWTVMDWHNIYPSVRLSGLESRFQKFLGFKEECPECKQFNLIWEEKIQLCKGCDYIHAFEYDDS